MNGTFQMKSGSKAGTQSLPTPMPMSADASTKAEIGLAPDYKDQVGGIVPGYSGHVPRARDKYAGSAHGTISNVGAQTGHVRPEDVIPPTFEKYVANSRGVMPGYTGYRPEARNVHNVSAFGGIPPPGTATTIEELGQGNRNFNFERKPVENPPPSFRDNVGGILPGYTGHVPRAQEKQGQTHYGGLSPDKRFVPLAQTGHEGYKVDPFTGQAGEKDVDLKMIPNYQGFIPKARDAFGTSIYTKGR